MQHLDQEQDQESDREEGATVGGPGRRAGIPLYHRIAAVLRRRIQRGELRVGDRLPSLSELIAEFDVGRITVRNALDELAAEGLITRNRDRRGSSVVGEPLDRRWFTLAIDLDDLTAHSAGVTTNLLTCEPSPVPPQVRMGEGKLADSYQLIVQLNRYKSFPDPVMFTEIFLDAEIFARIGRETLEKRAVIDAMADHGADIFEIQQTLMISEADIDVARQLHIRESAPIAEMRRVIRDRKRRIIYFGHLTARGDRVRLDFSAKRRGARRSGE